jgi:hypothetical protein
MAFPRQPTSYYEHRDDDPLPEMLTARTADTAITMKMAVREKTFHLV